MDSGTEKSVLWKHTQEKHQGIIPNFTCNVTGLFQGDPMLRQISESVRINREEASNLMNTKTEWNFLNLPRAKF